MPNSFPKYKEEDDEQVNAIGSKATIFYYAALLLCLVIFVVYTAIDAGSGMEVYKMPKSYDPGSTENVAPTLEEVEALIADPLALDVTCFCDNSAPKMDQFATLKWDLDTMCASLLPIYEPKTCPAPSEANIAAAEGGDDRRRMSTENTEATQQEKYCPYCTKYKVSDFQYAIRMPETDECFILNMVRGICKKAESITSGQRFGIMSTIVPSVTMQTKKQLEAQLSALSETAKKTFQPLFQLSLESPVIWSQAQGLPLVFQVRDTFEEDPITLKQALAQTALGTNTDDRRLFPFSGESFWDTGVGGDKFMTLMNYNWKTGENMVEGIEAEADGPPTWTTIAGSMAVDRPDIISGQAAGLAYFQGNQQSTFDTFQNGIDAMFVANEEISIDFTKYFNTCKPTHCDYMAKPPVNVAMLLAAILGIYGGLAAGLKGMAATGASQLQKKAIAKGGKDIEMGATKEAPQEEPSAPKEQPAAEEAAPSDM